MVHVGEPPPLIDEVFDILAPGDIVTHCFNGKKAGSITDTAALYAQAKRLADEGVHMDIGHGVASFDFETARQAIGDGMVPFSISTDLHLRNIDGPVHDLATTASKLTAVGLSLEECVQAITNRPRSILGLSGADGLMVGTKADFTVFDVTDASLRTVDSQGNALTLSKVLEPRMSVIGASLAPAARREGEGLA
jgi:dihydroorotase